MTDDELHALLGNEARINSAFPETDERPEPVPLEHPPVILPDVTPDPFAHFSAPEPGVSAAEPDSPAEAAAPAKPNRHLFLYFMLTLLVLGVLTFAVFCIVWDLRNGTSPSSYRAGNIVKVELIQHRRNDSADTEQDANGKYTIEGIAENVMPSIVEIYTYKDRTMSGAGSGIILSELGYIATNAHVLSESTAYSVRLYGEGRNESLYSATLVGHDSKTDLAVLKINADGLKPAVFGDSDDLHLGEQVCALGNPAGLSSSITTGIISGMNRKVRAKSNNFEMDCIQTDAAISPGNSGGALVDMYGQVIGITSSKYGTSTLFSGYYEGLGFAITINQALPILRELMEQGYVSGRYRIGITYLENEPAHTKMKDLDIQLPEELDEHGIWVEKVDPDSDLKNTALKDGDWILMIDGQDVTTADSIRQAIGGKAGGDSIHCHCGRVEADGTLSTFEIDLTLLDDQSGEY